MNARYISIVAVIQIAALGCAILFAGFAARIAEKYLEMMHGGIRLPSITQSAFAFRDYGLWGFILIFIWVGVALHAERSASDLYRFFIVVTGAVFAAGLSLMSVVYLWAAFLPLI
jgi:hypothetical protein